MSAEWLSAIAAIATFVVVLASGIAAVVQLRHMRGGNQIAMLTDFRRTVESEEFTRAMTFVRTDLPKLLADPVEARAVAAIPPFTGAYAAIRVVANFYEAMGVLAKNGIVDRNITCDQFGYLIRTNWDSLAPVIATVRANTNNNGLWENFEYLVVYVHEYNKKHWSTYPKGWPRMPVDTSLLDAIKATTPETTPASASS